MSKTILIMAAGTGGHIFPALAFAYKAKASGYTIAWLGTTTGLENQLVKDFPLSSISMRGVRRRGFIKKLSAPYTLLKSFSEAKRVLKTVKPDVVIGFGGYVTVPGGLAARALRIPLIIHEQNAVAGLANKFLSRFATRVFEAFADTLKKAICIGNPIRETIIAIPAPAERFKDRPLDHFNVLVLGGSLGAQALNQTVPAALATFKNISILHQCGKAHLQETEASYQKQKITAEVRPFIDDMASAYAWADVVICRAGALTVSELLTVGLPAILIPYPNAVDDHQTKNAEYLVSKGLAKIIQQKECEAMALQTLVASFLNRTLLLAKAQTGYAFRKIQAVEHLLEACEECLRHVSVKRS